MARNSDEEYISVKDFYRDRSIFITGGTGFMGKVLVEKLLRSCPGIKNIYLLIRPKKGQDVQQRLEELLNGPVNSEPKTFGISLFAFEGKVDFWEFHYASFYCNTCYNSVEFMPGSSIAREFA